mmetsp:Transcript_13159/g.25888  ORF Transcript_13159/g.25888 Transcript_13159/m.25888 type:complete len:132 (-) Transcript_13159:255-650(-)
MYADRSERKGGTPTNRRYPSIHPSIQIRSSLTLPSVCSTQREGGRKELLSMHLLREDGKEACAFGSLPFAPDVCMPPSFDQQRRRATAHSLTVRKEEGADEKAVRAEEKKQRRKETLAHTDTYIHRNGLVR